MLSRTSIITIGLMLIVLAGTLTSYAAYAPVSGFVLLLTALGMVTKNYIVLSGPEHDWKHLVSMQGIASFLAFGACIVFGLRLLAIWFGPLLQVVSWAIPEWMFPTGLVLIALGAVEFTRRSR